MEPSQERPHDQIEQAIERLGARHAARLRTLSEQIRRHGDTTESAAGGPWEREIETPTSASSSVNPEPAEPMAAPQPASAQPDPSALAAEPIEDISASQVDTSEQQWEALFTKASNLPASTTTSEIPPQVGLLSGERQVPTMPPTDNMGWRDRIDWWWQDLISRYAYRSRLIFMMLCVAVILGALMGCAILLVLNLPLRSGATEALLAATGPPMPAPATSAVQAQPAISPALAAPTGASRADAPTATTASQANAQPTAAAAAIPGARASTPTLAPTALAPTSTNALPPAAVMLQRVAAAEAALHRGQIEATISNADGTGAWAQLRFDFGDAINPPALHMTSIYTGTTSVQKVERISIGDRSWERSSDGRWSARPAREGVTDQVYIFLPHAESIVNTDLDENTDAAMLRWYETSRDSDVTLVVDPTSGTPRELRQVARATGTVRVVTYSFWNTAVDITPPKDN